MKTPEIKITYSGIYDQLLHSYHKRNLRKVELDRGYRYAKKVQIQWNKVSTKILRTMCEQTNLKWKRSEVRCYVVKFVKFPFSDPLTLITSRNLKFQISDLTHELSHILLDDNYDRLKLYWKKIWKRYKKESFTTKIHIPVEAIVISVFKKVFGKKANVYINYEKWWEFDSDNKEMRRDYIRAWNIVQKVGAENILEELKSS